MIRNIKKLKVREFCILLEEGLIKLPDVESPGLTVMTEGKTWSENGMKLRLDSPNAYDGQQKHIHVMTSKGEYVWNQDGSVSHKNRRPGIKPSGAARKAAAKALGIDMSMLEGYMNYDMTIEYIENDFKLLLESMGEIS